MNARWRHCSRRCRRRAMTLVEVLAGLAILATVVAMILAARGRYLRQSALAQRRLHAVAAADELLTQWWKKPQAIPESGRGEVNGPDQLGWQTQVVPGETADQLGARVLRLEITDERRGAAPGSVKGPLVSVEFLLPMTAATTQPIDDDGGHGDGVNRANDTPQQRVHPR
jgi:prepilin-type N-terminal cleavage/methylation domain-containing protein